MIGYTQQPYNIKIKVTRWSRNKEPTIYNSGHSPKSQSNNKSNANISILMIDEYNVQDKRYDDNHGIKDL